MSRRTEQVESLIGHLLGDVFSRSLEFPDGTLATISRVEVPPDLKTANVYISVLPFAESERVMGYLIRNRNRVQKEIAKGMVMKITPKIMFILDDLPEHASQIDRLIEEEHKDDTKEDES